MNGDNVSPQADASQGQNQQTVGEKVAQADPPLIQVDYRVFSIMMKGSPDDTLGDVNSCMRDAIEQAIEDIEKLKTTDRELQEQYGEVDATPVAPQDRMSH